MVDESAVQPKVHVRYFNGVKEVKHYCDSGDGADFNCKMGGKFIVAEAETALQEMSASTSSSSM